MQKLPIPQPTSYHTTHTAWASTTPHPPHQRARCLKFSPPLPTIQINNRRNAEEAYCVGKECPLIELPSEMGAGGRQREKRTRLFHALLTRSAKLLNVKRQFSICYCRWMRPPDKGYGESEKGVWWRGDAGSEAVFVSWRSMKAGSRLHLEWIRLF